MINEVKELIACTPINDKNYDAEQHAYFRYINDRWGFKFYHRESTRDKTFALQKLASEHGLAPQVRDPFEVKVPNVGPVYGYITECYHMSLFEAGYEGIWEEDLKYRYDDFCRFIYKLECIMYVKDMHHKNVGLMPDGRMVAIDFSECEPLDNEAEGW